MEAITLALLLSSMAITVHIILTANVLTEALITIMITILLYDQTMSSYQEVVPVRHLTQMAAEPLHLQIHHTISVDGDKIRQYIPEHLRMSILHLQEDLQTGAHPTNQPGVIQTGVQGILQEEVNLVPGAEATASVPVHMATVQDHTAVVHPQAVAEEGINFSHQ